MTTTNDSTYTTTNVTVKGNVYSVLVVKGKYNYISIRKETNNPFKTIGREFKSFDEAAAAYKTPEMKIELLKIELGF